MHKTLQKTLFGASAAAIIALAMPAAAQDRPVIVVTKDHAAADRQAAANAASAGAGVAAGTAAGVAITEGAIGGTVGAALPATVAGAAAAGGVAGIGAGALIHAAVTPCQGFHALLGNVFTSSEGCVNGRYVGVEPRRRVATRVVR